MTIANGRWAEGTPVTPSTCDWINWRGRECPAVFTSLVILLDCQTPWGGMMAVFEFRCIKSFWFYPSSLPLLHRNHLLNKTLRNLREISLNLDSSHSDNSFLMHPWIWNNSTLSSPSSSHSFHYEWFEARRDKRSTRTRMPLTLPQQRRLRLRRRRRRQCLRRKTMKK